MLFTEHLWLICLTASLSLLILTDYAEVLNLAPLPVICGSVSGVCVLAAGSVSLSALLLWSSLTHFPSPDFHGFLWKIHFTLQKLPCSKKLRNQLLGEGANAAAPPAAADGSRMGQWRSQQRREGKAGAFPTAAGADLQVRASQAGMGMRWSHWAVLVSKPMRTAVQRWVKDELTAALAAREILRLRRFRIIIELYPV